MRPNIVPPPLALSDNLNVKRYPILRLISAFYKFLAFLALTVGVIAGIAVPLLNARTTNLVQVLIVASVVYMVSGGFAAIWFYAIARLIDLLLETNNNTRLIAEALREQSHILKQIHRRQANPYPRPAEAVAARRAHLNPGDSPPQP